MNVESFGATDIGLVRLNNEDVWARMPDEQCFILADGMGGHKAGEIAASEAVLHLCKLVKEEHTTTKGHTPQEWVELLDEGVREANQHIYNLASTNPEMEGMGTTLCLALIANHSLIAVHVGDSRIYRLRKGRLTQLTKDHSLRDELIAKGELDESLASSFPYKNIITRAIGTQKTVVPEIQILAIELGDLYFLCTDGLTDSLLDAQIVDIIESSETLQESTESLILESKKQGGNDNITIVMVRIT